MSKGKPALFFLTVILILTSFSWQRGKEGNHGLSGGIDQESGMRVEAAYGKLPLYFIANNGQLSEAVRFYEQGGGHSTFFTEDGVYLLLSKSRKETDKGIQGQGLDKGSAERHESQLLKLGFLKANKSPEIIAEDIQEGRVNYFIGNDPKRWRTDIPTYRAVLYKEVWPGIDIRFYGNNQQLEYDIMVKPGAEPSWLKFYYEGVEKLRVNKEGALEIEVNGGRIVQRRPSIYQEIDGKRVEIEGKFKVEGSKSRSEGAESGVGSKRFIYGFEVSSYDRNHALIIDPVLIYSTYLGGNGTDCGMAIAVDSSGNAYLTGYTSSTNFPTASPIQANRAGSYDVFITKVNSSGSALIYSTYLGGSSWDYGRSIKVDSSGNVYITGNTNSTDFPTASPLQANNAGGDDAFIAKINSSGSSLIYSTYLGGSSTDIGEGIDVDGSGNAYIVGYTASTNFPTASPIQANNAGNNDVFITKINSLGSSLVYSTYLGGTGNDNGLDIKVNNTGRAYITGDTTSSDFPLVSPMQASRAGGYDVFVTNVNSSGNALVYSTYLGGNADDSGWGIAVDSWNDVYVTGHTYSTNFPTASPIQASNAGNDDVFISRINSLGSGLVYSSYLGGNGYDRAYGIVVDSSGNAYLTGYTSSTNFPTASPIQATLAGGDDVFITKINYYGNALVYSSYLGGSGVEYGYGIAIDSSGNAYITGNTQSTNFPTASPIQATLAGGSDVFITKINAPSRALVYSADFDANSLSERTVFRPSSGMWYIYGGSAISWGTNGDIPVSGYYNSDAVADIAVWRPTDGIWYVKDIVSQQWGAREDIPVPGNYGGDARTDFAVWRPSDGMWYIRTAEGTVSAVQWGAPGDIPVPGNYGGDARTDFAVWRPSNGMWYIKTAEGSVSAVQWGVWLDIPVPGDYNGDGVTEIAVFRPYLGIWYIYGGTSLGWGTMGDIPVPGDYGGDVRTDFVVFRPSNGMWYIKTAEGTVSAVQWGTCSDIPLGVRK